MGGMFRRGSSNQAAAKTPQQPASDLAIPKDNGDDDNKTKGNQYSQVGKSGNFRKKDTKKQTDMKQSAGMPNLTKQTLNL